MYEKFFGLDSKPFELGPNPDFLYPSKIHRKAIDYLQYGIAEGVGFILLTGEIGAGKTTILRGLIKDIDRDMSVSVVFNTRVDGEQLLALINEDFGLDPEAGSKRALLRNLNDFLIDQHGLGRRCIVIIDEAQNLSADALEEVRLLSNLETDCQKLVQVILVGQPELRAIIGNPSLRQLRQRISIHCHLTRLNRHETEEYIYHRLSRAGNREAVHFDEAAMDLIFSFSSGIPRMINLICDFVLLAACAEETRNVGCEMVRGVAEDIGWEQDRPTEAPNQTGDGKKNALATELFRRLTFIQNHIVKLEGITENILDIKTLLRLLEDLPLSLEKHDSRLSQLEESLARMEELLKKGSTEQSRSGQVVDLKTERH